MLRKTALKRLEAQIARLERQAAVLREKEKQPVIQAILRAINFYRITPEDLGVGGSSYGPPGKAPARAKVGVRSRSRSPKPGPAAKYRNPATGETWSGRGRPARWLLEEERKGRKRERFLVG